MAILRRTKFPRPWSLATSSRRHYLAKAVTRRRRGGCRCRRTRTSRFSEHLLTHPEGVEGFRESRPLALRPPSTVAGAVAATLAGAAGAEGERTESDIGGAVPYLVVHPRWTAWRQRCLLGVASRTHVGSCTGAAVRVSVLCECRVKSSGRRGLPRQRCPCFASSLCPHRFHNQCFALSRPPFFAPLLPAPAPPLRTTKSAWFVPVHSLSFSPRHSCQSGVHFPQRLF